MRIDITYMCVYVCECKCKWVVEGGKVAFFFSNYNPIYSGGGQFESSQ